MKKTLIPHNLLNDIQNLSDSKHTQSSQTNNVGWDIADLRTDGVLQVRKAKHEVSRSETSANDNAERKANPRDLPNITKLAQTAALTLALSFFIAAPAMAQDPVPTLDNLHNQGATIPDTNPAQVYPESAYTLTEIENADPENLPQNAITLYDKNDDGTVTPKYYLVNLKDSVTNIGEGDSTKYFEWSQNAEGNLELKEVSTPTEGKTTITVKYDTSSLLQRIPNGADLSSTDISGTFVNQTTGSTSGDQYGGAIYNNGTNAKLGDINADFIGNYVASTNSYAQGGAIYNNSGTIGNITGDFIGNYAFNTSKFSSSEGGAIYNFSAEIGNITGDFIGNYASSTSRNASGGAIYNENGTIGDITGDFIGNYASSTNYYAYGGAIENNVGTIGDITGDFIGNYVTGSSFIGGGAIYNNKRTIGNITGDFIGNYAASPYGETKSGAIYNNVGTIGDITGDFIGNYASTTGFSVRGGAIYNYKGTIGDITGDFIGNYASSIDRIAYGGAIYNQNGTIGAKDGEDNLVGGIYGSFINNYAKTKLDSQLALGGAVYTYSDMNFIADNQVNYFSGNYTEDYRGKINNAIFVETEEDSSPTIKLQAQNNGVIIFDDQIDGGTSKYNSETGKHEIDRTNAYNLSLTGDETGTIYLNNSVINAKVTSDKINLNLGKNNVFEQSDFTINSGSLGFINGVAEQQIMQSANINGNINMALDVDLQNEKMDTLPENVVVSKDAQIGVNHLNLLNDATKDETYIPFAKDDYKAQVSYTGASPIAYSPIYKYDISYDKETGEFMFLRGASSTGGNASSAFNPSVLASPVATQAGAYTTQLQTFNYAFQHADTFMNIPYIERLAIINEGKYALSPTGDATDVGTYSPLLLKEESAGFWVKPYASFENVPLKNGPKVSNINYGTLIGYDSPLQSISNGFERVLTGYIGYNGASQRYSGVDAYQNGGLLGGTATFYKGNFFNATTLSVGATAGDATTMYGSENYTMLLAGLGNKTGYNFEFFDGGMILQPSMLISYTFVNTFDYTNGAGVRIESDPMHAIQLAPGIKLIGNTQNGWQPYIGVSMVWNLLDESKVTADSVRLPEMSIKPYVQYGVGLQKRVNDKFLAFGQAMIHNGGRNGVSLSAGLRWKIGRE